MEKFVMAFDQGTTSSRCILFDRKGRIRSIAQKEFRQIYPHPGWVEHDPMEIWSSQISVATEAMGKIGASIAQIACIGITNQRETTIIWDKNTGKPVYNAIVWQCRRTADMVEELRNTGFDKEIHKKTGLIPDAYFSGTKIKWILEHVEGAGKKAEAGELLFGTVDTWIIWNLTKGKVFVTDYTNASRTMLFNIHTLRWDEKILAELCIPGTMLAEVKPSGCIYGYTDTEIIGGEIPIAGAAGDQQAALFGQCCFEKGEAKNTYGTGCFLLMNTGEQAVESKHGLITTLGAGLDAKPEYVLEGSVFTAGAAVQWLRDEMGIIGTAAESEIKAAAVPDTQGAYIVPAFTGLGAPYWNSYTRGTIMGITRGFKKEHLTRAVLESIAYQTSDILNAMEQDAGIRLKHLKVDGGASANNFLMQFQSNILGVSVLRPGCIETTALGAAYLAGLAAGYWKNRDDLISNWELECRFEPSMEEEKKAELLKGWKKAVACALHWESDS